MAKSVRVLTKAERAYLAGLIDGEGTITLARIHKGAYRQLSVSISNTERPLLDWVRYRALTPRNGRYSAQMLAQREEFIKEFFAIVSQGRPRQQCLGDNGAHIGETCLCERVHDGNAEGSEGG
jgi:hypothetical protein